MIMKSLIEKIIQESIDNIISLGEEGKRNVEALEGKRICLAEKVSYETAANSLIKELGNKFCLMAEGFPIVGDKDAKMKITLDPLDGTVYYVRKRSLNPFPITIPISLIEGNTYGDVSVAVVGDLTSKEIWSTDKNSKTRSNILGECKTTGNESHDSVLQFDFYFPQNAQARLKLKNPKNESWERFESQNAGSVASQLIKVAYGEADAYVGVMGPTTWEIAPGYLLVKNAGGYTLSLNSGKEFGETVFNPNQREPVIVAKDEELAMKIYSIIKNK